MQTDPFDRPFAVMRTCSAFRPALGGRTWDCLHRLRVFQGRPVPGRRELQRLHNKARRLDERRVARGEPRDYLIANPTEENPV